MIDWLTALDWTTPAAWLLVPLVAAALWWRARSQPPAVDLATPFLPGVDEADEWPRSWVERTAWLPTGLRVVALLALTAALAGPVVRVPVPPEQEGIDLLLAVDASSSMLAEDLAPSTTRLDVALDAAARFVAERENDRVGLLRFARFPDLLCPPTADHAALLQLLGTVSTVQGDGPEDATGIGTAVAAGARSLSTGGPSRVLLLFTDGAENVATAVRPGEISPVHAAQLCEELGVRVYVVAMAADGSEADAVVPELARRTGGRFFTAGDASAVRQVYGEIDRLERVTAELPRFRDEPRFAPFAGLALLAWLGATLGLATAYRGLA